MSKITNGSLTRSGTECFIAVYPYGYTGRQRVLKHNTTVTSKHNKKAGKPYNAADALVAVCESSFYWGLWAPSLGKGWSYGVGDGSPW